MTIQINYKPLHPTFAAEAEVVGAQMNKPTQELADLIKQGMAKYGVLVFRKTGLDDESHIALSRMLGELDDMTPYVEKGRKLRLKHLELFDVSNIGIDNEIYKQSEGRGLLDKGNFLFHTDSSFNARRAGYSLLLAHEIPPPGMGGETEFADARTAYDDLPVETKERIKDYVGMHSQHWSRRKASPGNPILDGPEYLPENFPLSLHKMVQTHEPSGRTNLYIASHVYKIQGMDHETSQKEVQPLLDHASQQKYVVRIGYENEGDLVIWDNTCVMHRATTGSYVGKYRRDVRRTTVHDMSSQAWGLNGVGNTWRSGMP